MSSMTICEEDISKELQQFNVKLDDREVLAKCKWTTAVLSRTFLIAYFHLDAHQ